MTDLPKTRSEARAAGSRWYFTGEPCVRGHVSHRYTSIGKCAECTREDAARAHVHTTDRRRAYKDGPGFISAASRVHAGKYSYAAFAYIDAHTKGEITCPEHGSFWQSPTNHIAGKGCPACKNESTGHRSRGTTERFTKQAREVYGDRYDYSAVRYVAAHQKVTISCREHGPFEQTPTNHLTGKEGCPRCNHMKSGPEEEVAGLLSNYARVIRRDRSLIGPKELDIFLPEVNLAVEFCGEYWHSHGDAEDEAARSMNHYNKHRACAEKGIRLLTIYASEWRDRQYALRRLLRNAAGKARGKVMARKCVISKVDHKAAVSFYERYHPQGGAGHGEHYGLYWKGNLVACMRFTHGANDRGQNKRRVWTLTRYATRVTVSGGASRLFAAFTKEHRPKEVKSFSDNRYFDGGMYQALGFVLAEITAPDYQVWHPKAGLSNKPAWQRRSIPLRAREIGIDVGFDPETDPRTERDMTYLLGARRIYDCGKKRWVWTAS